MVENKIIARKNYSFIGLIVLGVIAALLTFFTITWGVSYADSMSNHAPGMGNSFIGLFMGLTLFFYSVCWLAEFCVALILGIKSKVKYARIGYIIISAYALLGLAALWTAFLVVRF